MTDALLGARVEPRRPVGDAAASGRAVVGRRRPGGRLLARVGDGPDRRPGRSAGEFLNVVIRVDPGTLGPTELLSAVNEGRGRRWGGFATSDGGHARSTSTSCCGATWSSHDPRLTIPHPRLHERAFVVLPLLDLEPDPVLPDGRRLLDLPAPAGRCANRSRRRWRCHDGQGLSALRLVGRDHRRHVSSLRRRVVRERAADPGGGCPPTGHPTDGASARSDRGEARSRRRSSPCSRSARWCSSSGTRPPRPWVPHRPVVQGFLLTTAPEGSGARMWIWDLGANTASQGPLLDVRPDELVYGYEVHGGWVGITTGGATERSRLRPALPRARRSAGAGRVGGCHRVVTEHLLRQRPADPTGGRLHADHGQHLVRVDPQIAGALRRCPVRGADGLRPGSEPPLHHARARRGPHDAAHRRRVHGAASSTATDS